MKMVKSLLLGGAAGLLVVAGAQAADLPVKAKPVEYVKICSLYGAGFFYIPGTDTCIKFGGFVRMEWDFNASGSFYPYHNGSLTTSRFTRFTDDVVTRARAYFTTDVRSQTEYGTLRSYMRLAIQWTTNDNIAAGSGATAYIDRAFIQFAGFTFGRTQSFFDFLIFPTFSNQTALFGSDIGGSGINLGAYTLQLGNGLSASISVEENRSRSQSLVDFGGAANWPLGAAAVADQAGQQMPDIVGSLRVDQAWGSAQISGALHQVRGAYYFNNAAGTCPQTNTTFCGHPNDKYGWAVAGGLMLNLPWAKGDTAGFQVTYAQGATRYTFQGLNNVAIYSGTNDVALAWATDGVFDNGTGIELTRSWSAYAWIQHYWTPALRTSLYGGYGAVDYNNNATAILCTSTVAEVGWGPLITAACDPDFRLWQIGSRTVWNPVTNLDVSLDVIYTHVSTDWNGTATLPALAPRPAGTYNLTDEGVFSAIFRVQRNFWP